MIIKRSKQFIKEYPSHTVVISLMFTSFIGACMLMLPACSNTEMPFIDLLFLSASLTTVTGLTTISFQNFTLVGQLIILVLMQIGGLGLMTMSLFIMSLFVNFGLYTQVLASEILSIQSFKDTKRILLFLIRMTFICEMLGAVLTFFVIRHDYPVGKAIFLSLFHAVSSFCNVGISLLKDGSVAYHTNSLMMITTTLLILLGSLGFVTWHEFFQRLRHRNENKQKYKISWHTKLVLKTFFITACITGILFWILERNTSLKDLTALETLFHVLLISISTKSCGYLPIALNMLQPATILLCFLAAFIGSAPSSTGGGVKTSAFAIFVTVIRATMYGRYHAEIDGRRIATEQVYKAMALIALACSWITMITFLLLISETQANFIKIFFEAISAFSNNGMSLGITSTLSTVGKLLIMITMIVGRIGALTLIIGMKRSSDLANYSYPEERVILG